MPASNIEMYLQDARNNFDAMRPAPICSDANPPHMGQCHNVHVSTNCYYGYHHGAKNTQPGNAEPEDCEMLEEEAASGTSSPVGNARKRSASEDDCPQRKRVREEVQREKNLERETKDNHRLDSSKEDLLESLYWNIHGGNIFQLLQCL